MTSIADVFVRRVTIMADVFAGALAILERAEREDAYRVGRRARIWSGSGLRPVRRRVA